jgi:2-dehydropantoate 2-reductase
MRIGIVGAGAIGGWVAAKLALAGHSVSAFGRSGALASIRLVEGANARDAQLEPLGGAADLLIVAVKAPALAAASESARPLIGAGTLILPMLNGVPWWFVAGEPLQSVDPDGSIGGALPLRRARISATRSGTNCGAMRRSTRCRR